MLNLTWVYNILWGDGGQFRNDSLYYDGHGVQTDRFDERFPSTSQNPVPIPIKSPPILLQADLLNAGYWQTTYWTRGYWNPLYWQKYGIGEELISVSSWQPQLQTPIEKWELIPY